MKRRPDRVKKLQLSRETLRELAAGSAGKVLGGVDISRDLSCDTGCLGGCPKRPTNPVC